MRKLPFVGGLAVLSAAMLLGGCEMDHHDQHANMWASVNKAVAVLQPTKASNSSVSGVVWFENMGDHVHVMGTVSGLAPNSVHGFHIHEFGDASSPDGTSAGGHYNPEGAAHSHGEINGAMSHAGDLGNITADAGGNAKIDVMVHGISIAGMKDPIVGRGLVVHGNPDDLKSQPAGNAGPRIAVGVIGIAK
ncbi:MAG TPA: superoxide dismutase family protein [Phycisphaerae bacterium]|nr:superoxide dismutase family protein [Phycisphaerae bacterium]